MRKRKEAGEGPGGTHPGEGGWPPSLSAPSPTSGEASQHPPQGLSTPQAQALSAEGHPESQGQRAAQRPRQRLIQPQGRGAEGQRRGSGGSARR